MSPNSSHNKAEPTSYCASLQQIKPTSKVLFTPKSPDKSPADLSLIHSAQSDAPNSLASNVTKMSRNAPVIVDSPKHDQDSPEHDQVPAQYPLNLIRYSGRKAPEDDEEECLPVKNHRLQQELYDAANQLQLANLVARDKFDIIPSHVYFQKSIECLTDARKLPKLVSRLEIVKNHQDTA